MAYLGKMASFLVLMIGLASADKMETILQQFEEMTKQLASMNDMLADLERENLEKTVMINNQQKQLDIYAEQISKLTNQQNEYQQLIDDIKGDGGRTDSSYKKENDDVYLFNRAMSTLQNNGGNMAIGDTDDNEAYENIPLARSGRLVLGEGMQVGFSAVITPHDYGPLVSDQIVKFDKVLSNVGNAYHANSGIFTAPVDGLYAIFATISAWEEKSDHTYLKLVQNGNHICWIWVKQYGQSSQAMVLNLNQGDEIYVRTTTADNNHVILGATYSSFSGFLLY